MAKKDFRTTAQGGLDSLIKQTSNEQPEQSEIQEKDYKTSLILPESIYLKFKGSYLTPRKQSFKDFIVESMKAKLKEEGLL